MLGLTSLLEVALAGDVVVGREVGRIKRVGRGGKSRRPYTFNSE